MTQLVISEDEKKDLGALLKKERSPELISTYLYFISKRDNLHPVLCPSKKMIYKSLDDAIKTLENSKQLWRETRIEIGREEANVNERTKRIYICPFTGKVFADNTHQNPQDAIYDWVSKCPENTERKNGMRVKRFFISEDPEIIKNYIQKQKEPVTKTVYSSVFSGALYNSKEAVISDFKEKHVKKITLKEILGQNRFQIEKGFLEFIQNELREEALSSFVEAMAKYDSFLPHVSRWIEG